MKKNSAFLLVLTAVVALCGCNVQNVSVQNGEIPQEFIPSIQPYLGNYLAHRATGLFTPDETGTVQLELQGNRPILTSTVDLIGKDCGSSIGQLKSFVVETDKDEKVSRVDAVFNLDPGQCISVLGRTVEFQYLIPLFGGEITTLNIQMSRTPSAHHDGPVIVRTWTIERN